MRGGRRSGGLKTASYVLAVLVALAAPAAAQNLVIVNARVVDGKGGVIERGSVVVRDGKIASVSAGAPASTAGLQRIDAQGRTLMPGFIDAHRHIVTGDAKEWLTKTGPAQLQEFLDAGFTTVLCAICPDEAIEMRQRVEAGTVKGPRLLLGSIIPLARAAVPGGGRGDPARFDTSRPPLRPTTAAGAIPDADTMTTSRPAAWWFSMSSTASSKTIGSMIACRVSATDCRTTWTSQPVIMSVR